MPTKADTSTDLEIPAESVMLKETYRVSGLTVADLAAATGLSVGTVQNALNGIRYKDGSARVCAPPDATVVKLASLLRIHPDALRARGRARAAHLLEQELGVVDAPSADDASLARVLTQRVLAAFPTDELKREIERREATWCSQTDDPASEQIPDPLQQQGTEKPSADIERLITCGIGLDEYLDGLSKALLGEPPAGRHEREESR